MMRLQETTLAAVTGSYKFNQVKKKNMRKINTILNFNFMENRFNWSA